ncbi:glutaredoxin family protein [Alkalilimnicola ehrlichii]|uniref:glutaredoxin family protein n=1 Tax=Alkalilimnicola ehrlichii TaxID=351052 RepID=UPI0015F2A02D|nr:glutaredoxin family protein [Alkalilimnicola ehrlichii]
MKKLLVFALLLVVAQQWYRADRVSIDAAAVDVDDVVLYSTQWCGYCDQTRRFLDSQGVPYTEYDIEHNAYGRQRYDQLNPTGVPLLEVRGAIVRGHNPQAIAQALSSSRD